MRASVELQFDELADDSNNTVGIPTVPSLSDYRISRFEAHETSLHRLTPDADRVYPRRMGTSLQHHIAAMYRPSTNLLGDIDGERHPNVVRWVESASFDDRYTVASLGWLSGYKKFGDLFERAASLTPNYPTNSFADPWNIIGMWQGQFTQSTLRWFTMALSTNGSSLPHLIASYRKLGNAPENLFEQNEWGRGRMTSFVAPRWPLASYAEVPLGGLARTWTSDNIDELMAYRVAPYQVKALVNELYPGVKFETFIPAADVPFEVIKTGLIDKTPVEYLKAML